MNRLIPLAFFMVMAGSAQAVQLGPSGTCPASLPSIASFAQSATPSDTFIVPNWVRTSPNALRGTSPMRGGATQGNAHSGGHVELAPWDHMYYVPVMAPADGVVGNVTPCGSVNPPGHPTQDKFHILLNFAQNAGATVNFSLSMEPQAGNGLCGDFLIFVQAGDCVSAGDIIAMMPVYPVSGQGPDTPHIHFNLTSSAGMHCPNIFNASIGALYEAEHLPPPAGISSYGGAQFCFDPQAGQDLTGNP